MPSKLAEHMRAQREDQLKRKAKFDTGPLEGDYLSGEVPGQTTQRGTFIPNLGELYKEQNTQFPGGQPPPAVQRRRSWVGRALQESVKKQEMLGHFGVEGMPEIGEEEKWQGAMRYLQVPLEALKFLQSGQFAVVGGLKPFLEDGFDISDFGEAAGNFYRGLLFQEEHNFGDILQKWGITSEEHPILNASLGFVGDVALDPLTWLTFGGSAAAKGTALGLRQGINAVVKAEELGANLNRYGKRVLKKLVRHFGDEDKASKFLLDEIAKGTTVGRKVLPHGSRVAHWVPSIGGNPKGSQLSDLFGYTRKHVIPGGIMQHVDDVNATQLITDKITEAMLVSKPLDWFGRAFVPYWRITRKYPELKALLQAYEARKHEVLKQTADRLGEIAKYAPDKEDQELIAKAIKDPSILTGMKFVNLKKTMPARMDVNINLDYFEETKRIKPEDSEAIVDFFLEVYDGMRYPRSPLFKAGIRGKEAIEGLKMGSQGAMSTVVSGERMGRLAADNLEPFRPIFESISAAHPDVDVVKLDFGEFVIKLPIPNNSSRWTKKADYFKKEIYENSAAGRLSLNPYYKDVAGEIQAYRKLGGSGVVPETAVVWRPMGKIKRVDRKMADNISYNDVAQPGVSPPRFAQAFQDLKQANPKYDWDKIFEKSTEFRAANADLLNNDPGGALSSFLVELKDAGLIDDAFESNITEGTLDTIRAAFLSTSARDLRPGKVNQHYLAWAMAVGGWEMYQKGTRLKGIPENFTSIHQYVKWLQGNNISMADMPVPMLVKARARGLHVDDMATKIANDLAHGLDGGPVDPSDAIKLAAKAIGQVDQLRTQASRVGMIAGDLHSGNIIIGDGTDAAQWIDSASWMDEIRGTVGGAGVPTKTDPRPWRVHGGDKPYDLDVDMSPADFGRNVIGSEQPIRPMAKIPIAGREQAIARGAGDLRTQAMPGAPGFEAAHPTAYYTDNFLNHNRMETQFQHIKHPTEKRNFAIPYPDELKRLSSPQKWLDEMTAHIARLLKGEHITADMATAASKMAHDFVMADLDVAMRMKEAAALASKKNLDNLLGTQFAVASDDAILNASNLSFGMGRIFKDIGNSLIDRDPETVKAVLTELAQELKNKGVIKQYSFNEARFKGVSLDPTRAWNAGLIDPGDTRVGGHLVTRMRFGTGDNAQVLNFAWANDGRKVVTPIKKVLSSKSPRRVWYEQIAAVGDKYPGIQKEPGKYVNLLKAYGLTKDWIDEIHHYLNDRGVIDHDKIRKIFTKHNMEYLPIYHKASSPKKLLDAIHKSVKQQKVPGITNKTLDVHKTLKVGGKEVHSADKVSYNAMFIDEINAALGEELYETNILNIMGRYSLDAMLAGESRHVVEEAARLWGKPAKKVEQFVTNAAEGGKTEVATKWIADDGYMMLDHPALKHTQLPEEVVKGLTAFKMTVGEPVQSKFWRTYDKILGQWKGYATFVNMGFHGRNFMSNLWQLHLQMGPKAFDPLFHKEASAILRGKKGTFVLDNGLEVSYEQMLKDMQRYGVHGTGWFGQDIQEAGDFAKIFSYASGKSKGRFINPGSQDNLLFQAGKRVGGAIENEARALSFMYAYKKTGNAAHSALEAKKYMFDYSEITDFEKTVMKRMFPFYTWMRKNIALQAENVIKQPAKYGNIERFKTNLEAQSPGVDERWLPEYFPELYAVRTPFKTKKGSPLYLNPNFPFQDFNRFFSFDDWLSSTGPWKAVLELATNKNFFTKKEIQHYKGERVEADWFDILPDSLKTVVGPAFGMAKVYEPETERWFWGIHPRLKYAIETAFPPLRSYGKVIPTGEEQLPFYRREKRPFDVTSVLSGVKLIPYNITEQVEKKIFERRDLVREKVKAAERRGQIPSYYLPEGGRKTPRSH